MAAPIKIEDEHYNHATPRQIEILDAYREHGSSRKAAVSLGISASRVQRVIRIVIKRAAMSGYSPAHDMTHATPDPFYTKGVSSFYRKNKQTGEMELQNQWHKTDIDKEERYELIKEAITEMCQDIVPMPAQRTSKLKYSEKLVNLYTMTDCHMGMLAWQEECGAEWNMEVGERVLTNCFKAMVDQSPVAETCIIAQLGDFLHYDSILPVTPSSGHVLDTDTRFPHMVRTAIRVLRGLVDYALAKHKKVHLLMAEGNHDISSSIWLREAFACLYEKEPRVSMIESQSPFYSMHLGKVMLCWHHGHKKGLTPDTALMFAQRNAEMFGATKHRYIHFGDKHHWAGKEVAGFYLEQHANLPPPDAYAIRGGWDSHSKVNAITYHREYGEASRVTILPGMVA